MTPAESYRAQAAELKRRAMAEPGHALASQWEHLARCYRRLAEQADQNSFQDLWFEFGPKTRLQGEGEGP